MYKSFLLFSFLIVSSFLSAQVQSVSKQEDNNLHLYKFGSRYFDLNQRSFVRIDDVLADDYKSKSKFASRYKGLSIDQVGYRGKLFRMTANNGLLMTDLETQAAMPLINNEKDIQRRGQNYLIKVNSGVVHIKNLEKANGYMLYKYDQTGTENFAIQVKHSEYVEKGTLKYHLPYLKYKLHTGSSIVFTSYVNRIPKTVIVSTGEGRVSKFEFTSIGIIRDEKLDMDVHGFITTNHETKSINISYLAKDIKIERPYFSNVNSAETILKGDTLILATYNDMKAGANLLAINVKTQEVLWEADVAKLKAGPHQYYFNTVWLGEHQGYILLEGYEKEGRYLQIFDFKSGTRMWKSM